MNLTLKDDEYKFLIGYQKENPYRAAFNQLVKKVFGFSFEAWYQAGYWNEKYIPYTLFHGEKAVANASVNIMDFSVFKEQRRYIQIGTILTDEDYRNQGLSRFLIEKILDAWNGKSDFIYLYANHSVLDFYPKFGFNRVKEHEYFKSVKKKIGYGNVEQLNMDLQANRDRLYDYAKNSKVFGKLSMRENADIVMFYCTSFLKENVYHVKSLDTIVVAVFNEDRLHLWDVFSKIEVKLDQVVDSLINPQTDTIVLGFTPKNCSTYEVREVSGDDVLFVQTGKTELFDENKVMFPLLSHA